MLVLLCFLVDSNDEVKLLANRDYVVGRKEADIILNNDQSISRRHAVITINHPECNLVTLSLVMSGPDLIGFEEGRG